MNGYFITVFRLTMAVELDRWQWQNIIASEHGPPSATCRHVLLTISLHMNSSGESCWPRQELIARRAGISRQSVMRHINWSIEHEWIARYLKGRNGQGWRLFEYSPLVPDHVAEFIPEHVWERE